MKDPQRHILLVDDNDDDRAETQRILSRHRPGYRITIATTGEEGLRLARTEKPDCILLDFFLSDMDGRQFLDALAGGPGARGVVPAPVAVLSGQEDDAVARDVLSRGAQDYLVKDGLTGPILARAIENSVEKFHITRELDRQRIAAELRNTRLEALKDELQYNLAELADAQQARERFLAVMSHEMRTPLNAILGFADLLDLGLHGELNQDQREHVQRIRFGGRHLLDLINDVLDLARADARKLELDLRPIDLVAVLQEVTGLLQAQADEKGLTLDVDFEGFDPPLVMSDLQRLRQVLANLIGNAIKFTEDGGVRVRCMPGEDDTVRVEIRDTGIGIDPDVLPLVFDDFYQAHNDLTREKGGSGLGLTIARRLTSLMDGEILASSTLGEGSTFTLVLRSAAAGAEARPADLADQQARRDRPAPETAHPIPAEPAAAETRERVTVVAFGQDGKSLGDLERRVQPGVRLVWTTEVEKVADLAAAERPALVVLDIGSSDGAGWRAAHAVQEHPQLAHTAVLLLPAIPAASTAEGADALDLGWVSLVPKPFTSQQLAHAVDVAAHRQDQTDTGSSGYTVMVVDDDPDSRRVAATFLAREGVTVREEPDGESALLAMQQEPPHVVVLDLMMPVLDGFGVLATMRADPVLATVPVVVLTAKTLSEDERRFLARTAVRVLQKGEYRLADVAALVLRAAARAPTTAPA